ncbi:MAG: DUF898 domain-containing protein [Gammaproteobacteria bacterium]|uniref:Thymidylate kinase n=1 Tax=Marinobacter nitratireducens TaxID=1137280 RepID=A0A072MZ86_9GAMM|nr:YjgN family protein [Marinobacter nitratireducens]KEF30734.1 Thymidylate kinase [Marinobacter nitratireducens]TNE73271.1 MAG: DUF898 domain-containing protein [Gammaproteobacteria bacterium]TNF00915.1 MAG: DUF898 domain-containing protein [Gammaproteobacteria bacterium]
MSEQLYQIVFTGQVLEGFDKEQVKANLKDLFKASEGRIDKLFSPEPSVLKSGLSQKHADIYEQRLTAAGADIRVIPAIDTEKVAATDTPINPPTPPTEPSRPDTGPTRRAAPFSFTGRGGEYFGIWIVNILLTILTLGIYSAWATVRNNQYFYGNTQLDDSSFQYLANPITILKGRLIALAVLVAYAVLSELFIEAAIIFAIAFVFAVPWIMIRSLRFKAINSAYRNIRFDFKGSYGAAFMVTFVWPLLNVLCLLLLTPLVFRKTHEFVANGSHYGTTPFEFQATNGDYYRLFGIALLIGLGFGVAAFLAMQTGSMTLAMLIGVAGYLTIFGFFMAGVANLFFRSVTLEKHGFESGLKPAQMVWIYLSNSFLVVLTLGLFTPWAKVRMARYRADCTTMQIAGDLNHFVAAEKNRTSALGQELGDAFDVEFAAI